MNRKLLLKKIGKIVIAGASAIILFYLSSFIALSLLLFNINGGVYACLSLVIAILLEITIIGALWGFIKRSVFYIPVCSVFGACIAVFISFYGYHTYINNIPTVAENKDLLASYAPYVSNSKVVNLDENSSLMLSENLPAMDGATALFPVYSGFAKAVYPKELLLDTVNEKRTTVRTNTNEFLKCSKTTQAYQNIVTGDADIIFAAAPSDEQEQFAKDSGVELVYTPIGKEAFVFFVNAKNPIENITLEEIQKIYSGEITDWSELGFKGYGEIKAFQRDEGSGSQSTLEKVMEGKELITPPKEDVIDAMGGIIEQTTDYKNFKNAIGYSFRFYATEMVSNNQIKMLCINGAYPNLENIENSTYPLTSYFYAVTRSDADENTLKLLEWIKGKQGQKIIEMTGYTPLEK